MSTPDVLVDMRILGDGYSNGNFAKDMIENGIRNVYVYNENLFNPNNTYLDDIKEGVALLYALDDLNHEIKWSSVQAHASSTLTRDMFDDFLEKCQAVRNMYETYISKNTSSTGGSISFNTWLSGEKDQEVQKQIDEMKMEIESWHDNAQLGREYMSLKEMMSAKKVEKEKGDPTSLLIFSPEGAKTKFTNKRKKDGGEDPLPIKVGKVTIPPTKDGKPGKYYQNGTSMHNKAALENLMEENEKDHVKLMKCMNSMQKKMNELPKHYKDTRGMLFSKNKHDTIIRSLQSDFSGILRNNSTSKEKVEALIHLVMRYYAPEGKMLTTAKLNKEKTDHHFKRYLGLTLKEALGKLDGIEGIKLPENVDSVLKIEQPKGKKYESFTPDEPLETNSLRRS